MSNPQQPELRRSGETPSLSPDAIEGDLAAAPRPTATGNTGPVPPSNRAGSASGGVQDKPDLAKFAAKLGIDEPDPDGDRAAEAAHEQVQAAAKQAAEEEETVREAVTAHRAGSAEEIREMAAVGRGDQVAVADPGLVGRILHLPGGLAGTGMKVAAGAVGAGVGLARWAVPRIIGRVRRLV
jgi:hypothetical protein